MIPDAWLVGRRGQALAGGLACLALVLIWFGLIDPVRSWYADRALLLEQRQTLLHHMRDLATSLPALRSASANKRVGDQADATMLPGATDAIAAADLQERVQKMAATAGVSLTAVETLPALPAGRWHKVPLRISLNSSWPVLTELIRNIEQSNTRILIDDVHFHSSTVVARPTVLPIQASMVLYGFRQAEAGAGT
ncbi:MAG: ral secretion pathway protein [Acetobacteraceae bacterium]|jgi:general secretion pathway protein M|nr:ral secretion pathway protein [Acetobacteraceae bacterium]